MNQKRKMSWKPVPHEEASQFVGKTIVFKENGATCLITGYVPNGLDPAAPWEYVIDDDYYTAEDAFKEVQIINQDGELLPLGVAT